MNVIISPVPIQQGMVEILSTCRNISRNGMHLELSLTFKKGEIVFLRCINNLNTNHIDMKCEVVWSAEISDKNLYRIGLKFLSFTESDYIKLLEF